VAVAFGRGASGRSCWAPKAYEDLRCRCSCPVVSAVDPVLVLLEGCGLLGEMWGRWVKGALPVGRRRRTKICAVDVAALLCWLCVDFLRLLRRLLVRFLCGLRGLGKWDLG